VIPTALATALLLAARSAPAVPPPASAAQGVLRTGVPGPGAPAPAVDLSPRPPGASHAGGETRCALCHTGGVPPFVAGQAFACSPIPASVPPADCMHCHGNPAAAHQGVAGYLPSNPRCYECHRFSSGLPRSTGGAR